MHRWQTIAVATSAVVGAAALGYALHVENSSDLRMELVASAVPTGTYSFTVQATPVDDLYPGAVRRLRLVLTNPYTFDLHVTAVRADLVATSKPGCAPIAANLEVQPYTGRFPVRVRARDSAQAGAVPLHMPNSVSNDCQDATFSIVLNADAIRTGR